MTDFDIIGFLGTVSVSGYVTLYLSDGLRWVIEFLFDVEQPAEDDESVYVKGNELII